MKISKIEIGILIVALFLLTYTCIFNMIKPSQQSPETITIRKHHYDSMKAEILTLRQINEKVHNINISDPHFRDSVVAEYERRLRAK
jgi:hypothetical protein